MSDPTSSESPRNYSGDAKAGVPITVPVIVNCISSREIEKTDKPKSPRPPLPSS